MALGLDPFQQIVNVRWGGKGGVYVAGIRRFVGNPNNNVWTNKIKTTDELTNWEKTLETASGGFMASPFPGSGTCARIGDDKKPIFVLTGAADNQETGEASAGMIITSEDGSSWTSHDFGTYADIYLVTWNETDKTFYAGMLDYSAVDGDIFDVVLSSTDGVSWSEAERQPLAELYESPIEQHCSDKVTDIHDHKVPTSVFGYDEVNDILITPDPVNMTWGISYPAGEEYQHGDRLKITRGPDNDEPGSETVDLPAGMVRVWAVGYAAGVWQAAGDSGGFSAFGIIATSVDDGKTWTVTLTDSEGSAFANIAAMDQTVSSA